MARSLVICPTHDHTDTLFASIASLQAQTDPDWRLAVICDGAPERTNAILEAFASADERIEVIRHPKGERYGEAYRDPVVRHAPEEFVLHLGDDDVWHEDHLTHMRTLLTNADWAYSGELSFRRNGKFAWRFANLGTVAARSTAARGSFIDCGLNNAAFRRSAYDLLERGWQAAPGKSASDVHMWRVFLSNIDIRVACTSRPSFVKLAGRAARRSMTSVERLAEVSPILARINRPSFLQTSRLSADLSLPTLRMFQVNACDNEKSFEEALKLSGIRVVPFSSDFNQAIDGAEMALPLSEGQTEQLQFTWRLFRAVSGDLTELEALREMLPRFRPILGEYISSYARSNSKMFASLAQLTGEVLGLHGMALQASARNAIRHGDFPRAETVLREAESRIPNANWIANMRRELAAYQQ